MGTVAYVRISTSGQDLNAQRFAILDYAQQHGLVIDTFVESRRYAITGSHLYARLHHLTGGLGALHSHFLLDGLA